MDLGADEYVLVVCDTPPVEYTLDANGGAAGVEAAWPQGTLVVEGRVLQPETRGRGGLTFSMGSAVNVAFSCESICSVQLEVNKVAATKKRGRPRANAEPQPQHYHLSYHDHYSILEAVEVATL